MQTARPSTPVPDDGAGAHGQSFPDRYRSLLKPLLLGLVAAMLALAFVHLASEVGESETRRFDTYLTQGAQSVRAAYPALTEVMRDLSGLGSTVVMTLFVVATVGYLALSSQRTTAVLVGSSVIAGSLSVSVLKTVFGRPRPGTGWTELVTTGMSFPSGHASMAAIVFLTLGTMLASTRARRVERLYILLVATSLMLLVGLSRIGLGVHWATDVLGGWAFGTAWAMAWLLLAQWIAHLGTESVALKSAEGSSAVGSVGRPHGVA